MMPTSGTTVTIVNNPTGARANSRSLRTELSGDEKVVRAHCFTCDNSGVYCYTDIYSLMADMTNEHFHGKWEFVDAEQGNTIEAYCPSCVPVVSAANLGTPISK